MLLKMSKYKYYLYFKKKVPFIPTEVLLTSFACVSFSFRFYSNYLTTSG